MPGQTIGTSLLFGYPGSFSREGDCIIRNRAVDAASPNIAFGDPVVLNGANNTWTRWVTGSIASAFAGIAVREVKQATTYPAAGFPYLPGQGCDVLLRGACTVVCKVGTPVPGAAVYLRTVVNGARAIGDIEAAADGANSIALTNAVWGSPPDTNGVAEMVILSRQEP